VIPGWKNCENFSYVFSTHKRKPLKPGNGSFAITLQIFGTTGHEVRRENPEYNIPGGEEKEDFLKW
jgi:hypothetical protein